MIQSALHFPDLTERFTYSERVHTTHRKISAGFWSQRLRQKVTQNDRTFWSLTELQKPQLQKSTRKSARLQNVLSFCVSFWLRHWFEKLVENFLCVVRIRSEFVKHSTGSEEYSALWMMTLWLTKHFLLQEKWLSSGFLKFKSLKLCQASEYSIISCEFLAKTLTSEARRKFSMRRTYTFWVCKTFC